VVDIELIILQPVSKRDHVRIDIPDAIELDHQEYHGKHGQVVAVLSDDADALTDE